MSKFFKNFVFWGLISFVICIVGHNIVKNSPDFWNTSITSCLTVLVALVVSYYFAKKNQDERNLKDSYFKAMEKMQNLVNEEELYKIDNKKDLNFALMKKRELSNKVNILKKYSKKLNLENEIEFIDDKVQEYVDFLGNHAGDLNYLKQSEMDLKRPLELIDGKLQESMLKIFE